MRTHETADPETAIAHGLAVTAVYQGAGLTTAQVEHLTNLIAAVEAADPSASWVAVAREDVLGVVAALDRLVDAAAGTAPPRRDKP